MNYSELLQSSASVSKKTQPLRAIAYEVFKTLNDLDSNFWKEIFHGFPNLTHRKYNFYVHSRSTIKFGNKSLRSLEAHTVKSQ